MSDTTVRTVVRRCLRAFLDSTDRKGKEFEDNTNLIKGIGLSSDEGVDFVLDLCDALGVDLPEDFNPFIHESGHRGLGVSEMIRRVENFVIRTGATV